MAYENYLEEDEKLRSYTERLNELRRDGVDKLDELKQKIATTKRNKLISQEARASIIEEAQKELEKAQAIASANASEIKTLQKEAVAYSKRIAKTKIQEIKNAQNQEIENIKQGYTEQVASIQSQFAERAKGVTNSDELRVINYEMKSALFDAKNKFQSQIDSAKAVKNQAHVDLVQKNRNL